MSLDQEKTGEGRNTLPVNGNCPQNGLGGSVGQNPSGPDFDSLPATQKALQAEGGGGQYPTEGAQPISAPAAAQPGTLAYMQWAKRWLVWKYEGEPNSKGKHPKVPYYLNGTKRQGTLDSDADRAQLGSYPDALKVLHENPGYYAGLGFALGPDGSGWHWQGIDLDDVSQNQLSDIANTLPGYVELSPSGNGCHAIGYGRQFQTLGSNSTGIEAYAAGRFFTFTGILIRDDQLACLADFISQVCAPRHGGRESRGTSASKDHAEIYVDPKTVTELRSALASMRADDRDLWVKIGHALRELGQVGRGLWMEWSQSSEKYDPKDAAHKWDSFKPTQTGYKAVFAEAQRQGWVNPMSGAARVETPTQGGFVFKHAQPGGTILQIDYLIDPWLPRATVIGCYGRGEAGKSSWAAQICAKVGNQVSTLWISSEERQDHILQRHLSCGGEPMTLSVIETMPTKLDPVTKKPVATSFNLYEHMEPAILARQQDPKAREDRPLGIVVLDAVVALVTWGKGETPNDDAGVKRLIAHLFMLSERHGITFIMLGHLNKGTNRDHMADAVTGAAAWTNSVRLAYMFAKDIESESYEGFIRTVKSNTGTHFGATYRTVPVYTLRERPDGKNDVLCGAEMVGETVWGELALREMMAGEDDNWLNKREQKEQKVQAIVDATLQAVRFGPTTRRAVEATLSPEKVSKRHWQAADARLATRGVQVTNLQHGEKSYSLMTNEGNCGQ